MIIALAILSVIFAILAGVCKAICDLSEESKIKGHPLFWHKDTSWNNKWENGLRSKGERFWGSSRWFVALSDAWHLFGFLERILLALSFLSVGYLSGAYGLLWLIIAKVNYIVFATSFHIFYTTKIFRK